MLSRPPITTASSMLVAMQIQQVTPSDFAKGEATSPELEDIYKNLLKQKWVTQSFPSDPQNLPSDPQNF